MDKKGPFLLFLLIWAAALNAQSDSTFQLRPEKLTFKDLIARKSADPQRVAISATRSEEPVSDLPFSVWVVTAEDILLNGYVTLADVLRAAPGIRVSQPGNALEGETFLMRGLPGNRYVKILINDLPVKPTIAQGMPIAAQLPIRQAERIEVLYGPAAAMYGDAACAGVVNIILKESERPIFTQADLSFGALGYNSLDLMLGGKIGKDKRILRFSLFGSSTVRTETDVYSDQSIFNTNRYLPFGLDTSLYLRQPTNYRPSNLSLSDSFPKTIPIPHESRMFGANLTWRGIRFNYTRMGRSDFSGLGLSPLSQSWSSPSSVFSDRLETFALGFKVNTPKFTNSNTLSVLRYQVDKNSSASYIFDGPSSAIYFLQKPTITSPAEQEQVLTALHNKYNSQERYYAASGVDVMLESVFQARIARFLSFDGGLQMTIGSGAPVQGHFRFPSELDFSGVVTSYPFNDSLSYLPQSLVVGDANLFGQFDLKTRRFRLLVANSIHASSLGAPESLPRVAGTFRIDSSWMALASYSTGIRRPSVYEKVNTFRVNTGGAIFPNTIVAEHKTEHIQTLEGGFRYQGQLSSVELTAFGQNVFDMARPGVLHRVPAPSGADSVWVYGYQNTQGLAQQLWGIQGRLGFDTRRFPVNLGGGRESYARIRAEYFLQYTKGKEWFGGRIAPTNDVLNMPRWISQFRIMGQGKKLHIMLATTRQTQALSHAVAYQPLYQRTDYQQYYPKFRTWDFMLRFYLNNHFLLYCHVTNIFDHQISGLDATGTPDDLIYNPQQGRLVKFGVNYNMN